MFLPLWLVVPLLLLAAFGLLDRLLKPSFRWLVRRRVNHALEEANRRLRIRLQPFKLTRRRVLIDRLIYDPKVVEAADRFADENDMPREVAMEKVAHYAREIVPAFNAYVYFRLGFWLSRWVARSLYRVRLGALDERELEGLPPDATIVFVMNHRSNFDYLLVSYLVAEQTALSYAVGEWARVWPLESLIRSMGAYFVRRQSRNALYRQVLASYVAMATREGVTQAIYPEGGLSRDGALQPPKLGLLDYMLREFDPSTDRDVIFLPVGINYDRVLEDRTLQRDLEPGAKPVGALRAFSTFLGFTLRNVALALRGRWYRFGYARVNFGRPLSMKDYLEGRELDLGALPKPARFERIAELADELMGRVADAIPVLPTALVSTAVLRDPDRTLSDLETKAASHRLLEELAANGTPLHIPREDREYAVQVGLRMLTLRRIVERRAGIYHSVPTELALLEYYANSIAHHVKEASSARSAGA